MVRPLRGRNAFWASVSVGFTYGYSRCPASRDGNGAGTIEIVLILGPMGIRPIGAISFEVARKPVRRRAWSDTNSTKSALMLLWHPAPVTCHLALDTRASASRTSLLTGELIHSSLCEWSHEKTCQRAREGGCRSARRQGKMRRKQKKDTK
jgi:hypothetical protein